MNIKWSKESWDEYLYWQSNNKNILKKINNLIKEIERTPYDGSGKPEALKHNYSGYWSRRIDGEHRLVYKVTDDEIMIAQCKLHYG